MVFKRGCKSISNSIKSRFDNFRTGPKLSYIHVLSPNDLIQPAVFLGLTRDANDAVVMLDYIHRF